MADHVKPTLREVNHNHITLHANTNSLETGKTASQRAKVTIDLAAYVKNNENTVKQCLALGHDLKS